jgi:carbamoyl-phosphate synthase large subunit
MTGGGAPGAAGILKCLSLQKDFNVIIADANSNAVGKHLHHSFETIPPASATSFIPSILTLCKEKKVDIILPLVTKELIPLANNISAFENIGTKVLVSPAASLEIANNKSRLYEFLQWRGIAVPEFNIIETVEQFQDAVVALGYPEKEVCFKPSISNGSRGFRIITNQQNELDVLLNQKPTSTYISFADAVRILSSGKFPQLLVSEYLPGDEYSVDCIANHGESVIIVPRLRKRMINGISVEGEFVNNESIINYCRHIIKELQLHGNIGIQVKQSAKGEYLILEINPRVQGGISTALGAGINLPVLAIKQEMNMSIPASELTIKWGTQFSRYWDDVFY